MTSTGPPTGHLPKVFINCAFDEAFRAQRDAIVFTCVHAGFFPVMAGSSGRSGRPRLERILDALSCCRYSIHDLSRCRGEGDANLARFNMPLELGMAMQLRGLNGGSGAHEYLVLVPDEQNVHHRYISDLGGLDPQRHDGTPERIVAEVLAWLLTAAEAPAALSPPEVIAKLPEFYIALDRLTRDWSGGTPPWANIVHTAALVAQGDRVA